MTMDQMVAGKQREEGDSEEGIGVSITPSRTHSSVAYLLPSRPHLLNVIPFLNNNTGIKDFNTLAFGRYLSYHSNVPNFQGSSVS